MEGGGADDRSVRIGRFEVVVPPVRGQLSYQPGMVGLADENEFVIRLLADNHSRNHATPRVSCDFYNTGYVCVEVDSLGWPVHVIGRCGNNGQRVLTPRLNAQSGRRATPPALPLKLIRPSITFL